MKLEQGDTASKSLNLVGSESGSRAHSHNWFCFAVCKRLNNLLQSAFLKSPTGALQAVSGQWRHHVVILVHCSLRTLHKSLLNKPLQRNLYSK